MPFAFCASDHALRVTCLRKAQCGSSRAMSKCLRVSHYAYNSSLSQLMPTTVWRSLEHPVDRGHLPRRNRDLPHERLLFASFGSMAVLGIACSTRSRLGWQARTT